MLLQQTSNPKHTHSLSLSLITNLVYSSSSSSRDSHRLPAERFFVSMCICLVPGKKSNRAMSGHFWRMEQQKDRRKNRWSTSSADLLAPHFWGGLHPWQSTTLHSWQDAHKKVCTEERWRRRHPIYYWLSSAASFSGAPWIAGAAENCCSSSGFVQVSPSNLRLLLQFRSIPLAPTPPRMHSTRRLFDLHRYKRFTDPAYEFFLDPS
jgi:hypothetical protein